MINRKDMQKKQMRGVGIVELLDFLHHAETFDEYEDIVRMIEDWIIWRFDYVPEWRLKKGAKKHG